ncbi:hypothetical protein [Streptomyces sp. A1136]|uniref:hypothetical protein n=1 Tax=Streptomyces sp. A1136 TaxID=2563102 RepID=UPI00109EC03C|nr:hypothetical protein [Streptomyces sp. A1136]THA56095.1 hypothetical protein E6R62_12160 [Streptomyces sp. A1136]
MVATDPAWLSGLSYDQLEVRKMDVLMAMANSTAGGARAGVRPGDPGLAVTLAGTTINVSAGAGSAWRTGQGLYRYQLAATSPGTLAAAHASLSRIDLVYVRVWDNTVDSSGFSKADTVYLAGTAGSGVAPTPGATEIYTVLATITVPSSASGGTGAATVSTTARDLSVAPGGILPVGSTGLATAGLYAGQARYNTVRNTLEFWTGSAWASQGDWTAYTPTWGGGLATAGSSVSKGRWTRIGNRVEVIATLKWGTGSTMNSSNVTMTLPTAAVTASDSVWQGTGYFWDGVNPFKPLAPVVTSAATTAILYALRQSDLGYQSPGGLSYSWASGALMTMQLAYEAA